MRIGIIYPGSTFAFDTVPSMYNAATLLAREGYQVDIVATEDKAYPVPTFESNNVRFFFWRPRWEREGVYRWIPAKYSYTLKLWQAHRKQPYKCLIGVDPSGLARAHTLSRPLNVPLIYYSLELLLSQEIADESAKRIQAGREKLRRTFRSQTLPDPRELLEAVGSIYESFRYRNGWQANKKREIVLAQKSAFVIVQDTARAELLARDNHLSGESVMLVPNAPMGPARRTKKWYWHDRFGLPEEKKIVFYMGSLGEWTGVDHLVQSTPYWPDDWLLVVHTRGSASDKGHALKLREVADPNRVFFSTQPVPRDKLDDLIDSADLGTAFYFPVQGSFYTQENIQTIGLSSGKTAQYLRSGLPVIVNATSQLQGFVERHGCGIAIQGWEQIGHALRCIEERYDHMSQKAMQTFDEHLDFARYFRPVIDRINAL